MVKNQIHSFAFISHGQEETAWMMLARPKMTHEATA
jgi:hypothetical protein